MAEAKKVADEMTKVSVALDKVRNTLNEALASLQIILNDPETSNGQAIRANDLYKSLARFRNRV